MATAMSAPLPPPAPSSSSSSSSAWLEWAAEYTKAAQAEYRPPPEWAARVAAAAAAAGEGADVPWSAGLAEVLARALLSGAPAAAAWKYAEAALAARLASPALLLALLSTRYGPGLPARLAVAAVCLLVCVWSVVRGRVVGSEWRMRVRSVLSCPESRTNPFDFQYTQAFFSSLLFMIST
jgi:hypothetical protein